MNVPDRLHTRRHFHPAPPSRVTMKSDRTFEGINLDQPGFSSKQVSSMSRFQLCDACYANEAAGCVLPQVCADADKAYTEQSSALQPLIRYTPWQLPWIFCQLRSPRADQL